VAVEGALHEIRRHVEEAGATDYAMPVWLPFLPMILVVIGSIAAIIAVYASEFGGGASTWAGAALAIFLVGVIVDFYVVYRWIKRRNEHFKRALGLWSALVNFLEALKIGDPEVTGIKEAVSEARYDEGEKSAGGWTIATIVPFVIYYVYHFLNKDFVEHERRELRILNNLRDLLKRRDIYLEVPLEPAVKDRSTILYFILSLLTAGIFQLYWVYTLTKDPNNHFHMHRVIETRVLSALEKLATTAPGAPSSV